ncbi:MAG: ribonuclease HI family protein [Candidatus Omnitrophota bacterium]
MVYVYIDGACAGNPGKMGVGYVIYKNKQIIREDSVYLGIGTNNFSEYMAFIFSLMDLISLGEKEVSVYSDSNLLCEQLKGNFRVKNKNIYPLFVLAKKIIAKFDDFNITHIEREKNKEADRLAKEATGFLL